MIRISSFVVIAASLLMMSFISGVDTFPDATIQTLDGEEVQIHDYIGKGNPVIISFWASWCSPCKKELDAISEVYESWQKDYGVELLAITNDNHRGIKKVPAMVEKKGWPFTVLADPDQGLMKALDFQTIPQTFLVNGDGEIVYDHNGYHPGDEDELEEKIKAVVGK